MEVEAVGSGPLTCDITGVQRPIIFPPPGLLSFVAMRLVPFDDLRYKWCDTETLRGEIDTF